MPFIDLQRQYQKYKDEIHAQMETVLNASAYIMGPKMKELEETLSGYVGVKHALAVSSGTDALLISLMALGIKAGDEVITSAFSFFASCEVISFLNAKPVFVDIDPVTYNINPDQIESKITKNTKAIMPVSLYGQCADFEKINSIGRKYDLPVIEDACQSFGATCAKGRSCGLSSLGCTSFFPSKPLGCYGDGGMIFTNDSSLAEKMYMIRAHGQKERYRHDCIGVNGRLDALQAAVLLGKWPHFEEEVRLRNQLGQELKEELKKIMGVIVPETASGNSHVYAQFSIQVESRDAFAASLQKMGVPTAVHYPVPLPFQPVYESMGFKKGDFPVSEDVAGRIISLPFHPFLTQEERHFIVSCVQQALSLV
ncbi:MAG: DegT/DnrJ/EryC1/StrS family aminotransferase [Candidatus Aureabacteria bacterium]|nr:DegT/DnrJ/EryC1/StrS family aminotransferase [Candidatus Auribacterota bacterium]